MKGLPAPVKFWIKVGVAYSLYYTGLLLLWQRIAMRGRAVVLMYHRVLSGEEHRRTGSHPAIVIDRATFETQMELLQARFRVLSVAEFAECLEQGRPFPDRSCLITFDDGWLDNFTNALPVLQRHGFPALVFLPVNYVGTSRLFWPEALTHLLCFAAQEVRRQPGRRQEFGRILADSSLDGVLDTGDADPRAAAIAAVREERGRGRTAMEAVTARLADALGVTLDSLDLTTRDGFMDWATVDEMTRCGITFGGHGADHHLLTEVPPSTAREEIDTAKRVLDARLPQPVTTFSYPNGYWTPEVREMVRAAGYRLAFVTRRGLIRCTDDRLTLSRLNMHEAMTGSKPMFLARILGVL